MNEAPANFCTVAAGELEPTMSQASLKSFIRPTASLCGPASSRKTVRQALVLQH